MAKKFSQEEFSGKKLTLVYNSFLDKDFKAVLAALKPVIEGVLLYHYHCEGRELGGELINKALNELEISHREFEPSDMNDIKEAKNGKNLPSIWLVSPGRSLFKRVLCKQRSMSIF